MIHIENEPIKIVRSHKHLGLILTPDLDWHDHIHELLLSASQRVGLLRWMSKDLRCNAAFAILFCAEAAVPGPESIVRLYAVVSVTDLVIRPRGRKRGSANFDLDRSFDLPPALSTRKEWKPRTKTRQCCADIRSPRAAKRVIFQSVGTRGECSHSKQQRGGRTSDEQQRRSEDAGAVDAHLGEPRKNAAGAVVEEFQF